jgi:hypothetical protein
MVVVSVVMVVMMVHDEERVLETMVANVVLS